MSRAHCSTMPTTVASWSTAHKATHQLAIYPKGAVMPCLGPMVRVIFGCSEAKESVRASSTTYGSTTVNRALSVLRSPLLTGTNKAAPSAGGTVAFLRETHHTAVTADSSPVFDVQIANSYVGLHILVGITEVDSTGKPVGKVQLHGIITRVSAQEGIVIEMRGKNAGRSCRRTSGQSAARHRVYIDSARRARPLRIPTCSRRGLGQWRDDQEPPLQRAASQSGAGGMIAASVFIRSLSKGWLCQQAYSKRIHLSFMRLLSSASYCFFSTSRSLTIFISSGLARTTSSMCL